MDCPICDGPEYEDAPDQPNWRCFQIPGLPYPEMHQRYGFLRPTHAVIWRKVPAHADDLPDGLGAPFLYHIPYGPLSAYAVPDPWFRLLGLDPARERSRRARPWSPKGGPQ